MRKLAVIGCIVALTVVSVARSATTLNFPAEWHMACSTFVGPSWAVAVHHDNNTIQIMPSYCQYAIDVLNGKQDPATLNNAALTFLIIGHELSHDLGTHDLNVTATGEDSREPDCVGYMLMPWVMYRLGVPLKLRGILENQPIIKAKGLDECNSIGLERNP